jgi:hypothetical protein
MRTSPLELTNTVTQYDTVIDRCRSLFLAKARDYGTAWAILRMPSVTDQIYIKAERIRSIQETGENRVGDSIESEFIGIVNYCAIALMLLRMHEAPEQQARLEQTDALAAFYDEQVHEAKQVMSRKNHDYGEAWRKMRISSITDLILMKIHRLKQIEDNQGKTEVSEGVAANYIDMLNYAAFCLIKIGEQGAMNSEQ